MRHLLPLTLLLLLAACTGADCPYNSLVYTQYQLMRSMTEADTLSDTLSVYTHNSIEGFDTVVLNQKVNATTFTLPISYTQEADTFYFVTTDTFGITRRDIVVVTKDNRTHFESADCQAYYFHTLTSVGFSQNRIDSIHIVNSDVTYDVQSAHFYIFFKHDE